MTTAAAVFEILMVLYCCFCGLLYLLTVKVK